MAVKQVCINSHLERMAVNVTVENHVLIVNYVQCSIVNLLCHTLKY